MTGYLQESDIADILDEGVGYIEPAITKVEENSLRYSSRRPSLPPKAGNVEEHENSRLRRADVPLAHFSLISATVASQKFKFSNLQAE